MKRTDLVILLLILALCAGAGWTQGLRGKSEKFEATVIAEEVWQTCVYHPCAAGLIVRLERGRGRSLYARVSVEYFPDERRPQRGFPLELTAAAKKWKFDAVRDPEKDGPAEKILKVLERTSRKDISEEVGLDAWRMLPGAAHEKIPFDQVLPFYRVKPGKYKEVRK